MQRKEMVGHTVYLYEANDRRMPVLILEPRTEVTAKERYSTYDAQGQQLQVGYIRGDAPKTPGMLAIQWTAADSADEAARRLEELKDLDQSLITSSVGSRILPDEAVAMVVWPKNIVSTWAGRERPYVWTEADRAHVNELIAARDRRDRDVNDELRQALIAHGLPDTISDVNVEFEDWDDHRTGETNYTVHATIDVRALCTLLNIPLPAQVGEFLGE
ncbi:hypothetical protein [Curtobacterium sp. MCSS17_016]|uniref:hypothetical protein n=1 Tax=Curtobacterium sp. MCSS17_016 TaxID=2175644 RepID=UPI000DAA5634|nr:hypothetical protein [Curtobacterium sp. MCSS17_016]WIE81202.1 hypothetical protein DEJ19_018385 [Curtobacterium sp. MCSS17_016]